MNDYIGLDVSMKKIAISIRREGERVWRGKSGSAGLIHQKPVGILVKVAP